jgi:hypothetical protein
MFDLDVVLKHGFADGSAGLGADFNALWAVLRMRHYFDDGHRYYF